MLKFVPAMNKNLPEIVNDSGCCTFHAETDQCNKLYSLQVVCVNFSHTCSTRIPWRQFSVRNQTRNQVGRDRTKGRQKGKATKYPYLS